MAMPNTAFTRAINNCRWSGSRTFGYGAADLSVGADDPADFAVAADGTGSGGRLPDDEIVPANSEPEPIQKKRATLGGSTLIAELREFT